MAKEVRTLCLTIDMEVSEPGRSRLLADDHLVIIGRHPHLVNPTDALHNMITDVVFEAIAKLREGDNE